MGLMPVPVLQFNSANGVPLAGGLLYSYAAGTTTPQATYTDATLGTPNTNPIVLNSSGQCTVWLSSLSYKFVLTDSLGNVQWTSDQVCNILPGSLTTAMLGAGVVTSTNIANGAVGSTQIATGGVATGNLANSAVTGPKIAAETIEVGNLDPAIDLTQLDDVIEAVVTRPYVYSKDRSYKFVPQYPWSTPIAVTAPATLPAGNSQCVSWSPSGSALIVGGATSPYTKCYQRIGGIYVQAHLFGNPPAQVNDVKWSPDGSLLLMAYSGSPYLNVYQWNNNWASIPSTYEFVGVPAGNANGIAWCPVFPLVAVANTTSPYITIFSYGALALINGLTQTPTGTISDTGNVTMPASYTAANAAAPINTAIASLNQALSELVPYANANAPQTLFVPQSNPAALPAGNGMGISWSPDGQFLAVAHTTSPFVTIYQIDYSTFATAVNFTKLSNPSTLPAGNGTCAAWSADSQYLAVGCSSAPYIVVYQVSGNSFTALTAPVSQPGGSVQSVAWSPNGQYLAVGCNTSPYLLIYQLIGGVLTLLTAPVAPPAGTVNGLAWSPNGQYLAVANTTTPFMMIYETSSTLPSKGFFWVREIIDG